MAQVYLDSRFVRIVRLNAYGSRLASRRFLRRSSDVDLECGTLTVRATLQRIRYRELVPVEPKSNRSHRTIALPGVAASALKVHRIRHLEEPNAGWFSLALLGIRVY